MAPVTSSFIADRRTSSRRAFTLVEMLGVLAVILILALVITPVLLQQLNTAAKQTEAANLATLANGYRNYVMNNRSVPAASTVFSNIAGQIGWSVFQTVTNARGYPRYYLVDPGLLLGTNTGANLPYIQGTFGAPTNQITNSGNRVLFVSCMGSSLPTIVTNPGASLSNVFYALWNAADGQTPPPPWWSASWGGDWSEILIQRVSLKPLLCQLILNNASTTMGEFSIDNTNNHVSVPGTNAAATSYSACYFLRTVLGLHATGGVLQSMQILQDVALITNSPPYYLCPSFVYESGTWRGRLFLTIGAQRHTGLDLQAAYNIFTAAPQNPTAKFGVTQAQVTTDMYNYLSNYVYYATNGAGFLPANKTAVQSSQTVLAKDSANYIFK